MRTKNRKVDPNDVQACSTLFTDSSEGWILHRRNSVVSGMQRVVFQNIWACILQRHHKQNRRKRTRRSSGCATVPCTCCVAWERQKMQLLAKCHHRGIFLRLVVSSHTRSRPVQPLCNQCASHYLSYVTIRRLAPSPLHKSKELCHVPFEAHGVS